MRSLAQQYDAKIDVSRSHAVLRVTAEFDTCGEVFKSILYLLENIRMNEVNLSLDAISAGTGEKREEISIRSLLDRVEKVTSTAIKAQFNIRKVNASEGKVISGSSFCLYAEVDLVTYLSPWSRRRGLGRCTDDALANTTADSPENLVCILDWCRKTSKR